MSGQPLSPGGLDVSSSTDDGAVTVTLRGELDLASVPTLEERLIELEQSLPPRILIDLTALTFIDSSGLRVLLLADGRAREQQRELIFTDSTTTVRRVLEMTGALDLLRFQSR
ncbi:MAG TPA: STAS domain-containing protein [Solirubrobacteraceae bacterium]|nr:STAS domain-containing protein [Solirubrobacteraceae bacterium]